METVKALNYQVCGIAKMDKVGYGLGMDQAKDKDIDRVLQRIVIRIIEERFGGNQAAFCRALGFNPTYINAVVKGSKNLGKANWEKIRTKLDLRTDEFLQTEETPVERDPGEQQVLDWYRDMKSSGMVKEAEMMMEYLKNSAKKKAGAGGAGTSKRVARRSHKRAS